MSPLETARNHLLALIAGIAAALITAAAFAHQAAPTSSTGGTWQYDASCCSMRDCAPVPARFIRATAAGLVVSIPAGAHPFVTDAPLSATIPYGDPRIRASGDGEHHACISPSRTLLCIYVPPGGV